ncbi:MULTISPECIES: Ger(x)C family spore germination protein [Paenibacillus]|uniref:Ger(x)C family spore germination protein n=1 Tax=Paenibacillus TaxID=44249 RepID=UPI0022B8DCE8|nr:Ger(x)C family spore germination protein [Paenibacillus caseinilyticus]MCZ8524028.1 Ger(x)C family spore germination protein [Paenibacillus caseinilyticus]
MKKRNWIRVPLAAMLLGCLTGCWDRTEINDLAFVLTSALDIEKDGKIRYSVLVPLPGQMGGPSGGGGGTGGEKSYYIDSETGNTSREAQSKLQQRMSRRMFLAHRRTVLVGEELAKKGIRFLFDAIPRTPESRMTTYMIVTKGKAYDMLKASPKFERFPSEAIRELVKSRSAIQMNMKDVGVSLSAPGTDPVLAYMTEKESQKSEKPSKEVEMAGYAQFKDDKMIGTLEGAAADGLAWLKNQTITTSINVKLTEEIHATARIYDSQTHMDVKLEGGKPRFQIKVQAKSKILEITSYFDLSRTDKIQIVEKEISAYIKKAMQETIKTMQQKEADSAMLGGYIWRAYPRLWEEQYAKDWPAGLKDAEFQIEVSTTLMEPGDIYNNVTKSEGGQ